jgi:hypothetical protein
MKKNNKKTYTSPVLKKFGAVAKITMKGSAAPDSTQTAPGIVVPG